MHLGLMHSGHSKVLHQGGIGLCCVGTAPLKGEVIRWTRNLPTEIPLWKPSQANGWVLLASADCRLFGEAIDRVSMYVLCGGKGAAPGRALKGAKRYQAVKLSGVFSSGRC